MKPPCSHYQHLYTVIEQQPIPLCLNSWAVLAYESVKQINASLALILLVEAERLTLILPSGVRPDPSSVLMYPQNQLVLRKVRDARNLLEYLSPFQPTF